MRSPRISTLTRLPRDAILLLTVFFGGSFVGKDRSSDPSIAVVLGAQVLSGGRPSRTLEARTLHAARLYSDGAARKVVVTGGVGENPPSEAKVMAEILHRAGVPENDVILEDEALSTWDSAWLVAEISHRLGEWRVLAVTDPLHCVRVAATFREAGIEAVPEPVYSSPMWRNRALRFGQFFREAGAIFWYRTMHGVGSRFRL